MFWNKTPFAGFAILLTGCGAAEEDRTPAPEVAVPVAVVEVAETSWPETFEAPGTVRPRSSATVSSRAMGYVREVRVREGDRVNGGDAVVVLNAREAQVAHRQAQAALDEARASILEAEQVRASAEVRRDLAGVTLRRMQELLDKRSVSQHEFDQATAQRKVAEAAVAVAQSRRAQLDEKIRQAERGLEAAETQLTYLEVRAPFGGRVTRRIAEPGVLAAPGVPLLEIENDAGYRLEVAVPEAHLRAVRVGQTVEVRLEAADAAYPVRVEEIVPEIDAGSRTFLVKLALRGSAALRAGLFGRALFRTGERSVLTVPQEAVAHQGQLANVLAIEAGVARLRLIRAGEERDGQVEVLAGLSAGERIVSPRLEAIADGRRVEERH